MKLLLAQMRSQDPLSPMDGQDFFSQLAQLSILERMWEVRDSLQDLMTQQAMFEGSALIGKTVEAGDGSGGTIIGTVTSVVLTDGKVFLDIGGEQVPLNQVRTIY